MSLIQFQLNEPLLKIAKQGGVKDFVLWRFDIFLDKILNPENMKFHEINENSNAVLILIFLCCQKPVHRQVLYPLY